MADGHGADGHSAHGHGAHGHSAHGHSASLADRVEGELRRGIGSGEWRPGELLPSEGELAVRFGVSRTVVREAISRLRAAGLVETRRGRGSSVLARPPAQDFTHSLGTVRTPGDRLHLLELRRGIEVEAAALAAARRTPAALAAVDAALRRTAAVRGGASDAVEADFAFHRAVAAATANRFYLDLLDTLGAGAITRPYAGPEPDPGHLDQVLGEHRRIRDAIASGDAMGAAAAMRTHLDASMTRLRGYER
ncbi:FadR/GntR family transcriptional regulator [Nonomuraea rubra]|uniref:GntR family transcriptional repressor for pyruvate dehydrogenase complex n=1 Tax=Nonomuraea rubra TaxID=46180 RepID=A0A7X0NTN2_9ACTN|nr:FCD domain-containing protein [Nonomuraea rubra]MBB6549432.1 GntR family transcriptional repressor for pyruvate dehydrogenase complex [Nonomuraea rubra]